MPSVKPLLGLAITALAMIDGAIALLRSATPLQFLVEAGRLGFACGVALLPVLAAVSWLGQAIGRRASERAKLATLVAGSLAGGAALHHLLGRASLVGPSAFAWALFGVMVLMMPLGFVWTARVSPPTSAARR